MSNTFFFLSYSEEMYPNTFQFILVILALCRTIVLNCLVFCVSAKIDKNTKSVSSNRPESMQVNYAFVLIRASVIERHSFQRQPVNIAEINH